MADTYSGTTISITVITMCYAMAHAIGDVCNTVHGISLAAMTLSTMRHYLSRRPEKYAKIGAFLKRKQNS